MDPPEFVASYFDAWNKQDSQAVADHLAVNGTYLDMPVHLHLSRQQLVEYLDELFALEINYYELTGEVLAGPNTIAFQYKVSPRRTGADSQESESWFGAEFITLRDGAAVEIADYYKQHNQQSPMSPVAGAASATGVQRYAKSGLSSAQMATVMEQLRTLMANERLYLRPDLTLPDLAETLDCTVNHVSQAINAGFGISFFDYLNEHRVRDAMALLRADHPESRTVLDVALEVGFNSTSTFYVAFKKVTGETPAQFRRAQSSATGDL